MMFVYNYVLGSNTHITHVCYLSLSGNKGCCTIVLHCNCPKRPRPFCADHDFSTIEKITPTVHACPNTPKYLTNSLYIGEEGGDRLRVALHSATICKSDVFQHNYAVLNDLVEKANDIIENKMQPSIDMNSLSMEGFTGSRAMPLVTIFKQIVARIRTLLFFVLK